MYISIKSLRPRFTIPIVPALLFLGCLSACTPDSTSVQEDLHPGEGADFDYSSAPWPHPGDTLDESRLPTQERVGAMLKDLGYSQFGFEGNSVVVEDDMVLHRSDFLPHPGPETPALAKVSQRTRSLNGSNAVDRHYTWLIYVHPNLPANWRSGAVSAINAWKKWGKFKFAFTGNINSADLRIVPTDNHPNGTIASAAFPREVKIRMMKLPTGKPTKVPFTVSLVAPGNMIKVNTAYYRNHDANFAFSTLIHELGHCVGFTHTNGNDGVHIPGTPKADGLSFMNTSLNRFTGSLTKGDMLAIKYMYP